MTPSLRALVLLWLLPAAGCFHEHPEGGAYACDDSSACPTGYYCASTHTCWPADMGPGTCTPLHECPPAAGCGTFRDPCTGEMISCAQSCRSTEISAITPTVARAGATVMLEGTFGGSGVVHFPGSATPQPLTVLGAHRAQVTVPDDATAGPLVLTPDGGGSDVSSAASFRRAPFALGIGPFETEYPQADLARQMPRLDGPRPGHVLLATATRLYAIGGGPGIQQAAINGDGTLQPFHPAGSLRVPRSKAALAVAGSQVFVVGGQSDQLQPLQSIEQATIGSDGALGPFTISPIALPVARVGATAVVIGDWIYVLGGVGVAQERLASVVRAPFSGGVLGPFEDAGVSLRTARAQATATVVGNRLFVVGGFGGDIGPGIVDDVEEAHIGSDGTLGRFSVAGTTIAAHAGHTALVLDDALYVIGGGLDPTTVERAPLGADGTLGPFVDAGVTLTTGRGGHSSAIVGNQLYVLGGDRDGSIERASINVSGAIGSFVSDADAQLAAPYVDFVGLAAGSWYYVLSGANAQGPIDAIERAPIFADGRLGAFTVVPGRLAVGRWWPTAFVAGDYLYVTGGSYVLGDQTVADSVVHRATIGADGTLSSFSAVDGVTTRAGTWSASAVVVGDSVYLVGGYDPYGGGLQTRVERATIFPDGSISNFAIVPGVVTTPRGGSMVAVAGSKLWVLSGTADDSGHTQVASIGPDGSIGGFVPAGKGQDPLTQRDLTSAVVIGPWLYYVGGRLPLASAQWPTLSQLERAPLSPGALGPFESVESALSQPRRGSAAVVLGNWVYAIGGLADAAILTSDRAPLR